MGKPDRLARALDAILDNAVSFSPAGGLIEVAVSLVGDQVRIRIDDEGPGLSGTTNLFVPFFTTKPGGSGIGLALSRQIAEAHGGSLSLGNRDDGRGCIARLRLPLGAPAAAAPRA